MSTRRCGWRRPSTRRLIRANLAFHCGCPLTAHREDARFALLAADDLLDLSGFDHGNDRYPDQSCTLLVQLPSLDGGAGLAWRGPGIETEHGVALPVADGFWREREQRNEFPRGLDLFFTAGHDLIGLPRSTRVIRTARSVSDVRSRQGWRTGHRQCPPSAGEKTPGRYLGH